MVPAITASRNSASVASRKVTIRDRAVPGSEEAAIVSVTSHPLVASARLILRVGAAPSTLPLGGSAVQQCSQAAGTSCTITVIGVGGEVNPLPGTPLEVVDVRSTGSCAGVGFRVASPTSVEATWAADAPGATCAASFSVRDAQSRVTSAERDGRLLLDLLGYPKAPASVSQTAYASGSLTLRVDPGEARQAYPALSGFVIRSGGQDVAQCAPDGTCPDISAPNGEERAYEAFAVNSVGQSQAGVRTTAWAYDTPPSPSAVSVRPVVTGGEGAVVALSIEGLVPSETGSVEISSATGERVRIPLRSNQTSLEVPSYRVGTNSATTITVTPFSRFALPPGLGGSESGAAVTVTGNGVGAPLDPRLSLSSQSNGDGTATVTARASALRNGDGSTLRFGIAQDGNRCTPVAGGETATFTGLQDGNEYRFDLCVESWWQDESFGSATATETVRAVQSGAPPTGWTFVVAPGPTIDGQRSDWLIRDAPQSGERVPNNNRVEFRGWPTSVVGQNPNIEVRYVHRLWGTPTPWASVTPRAGSAPYQVQANWRVASCVGGSELVPAGDSSDGRAAFAFGNAGLVFTDAEGGVLERTPDTWTVPPGAVHVEGITVSVNWDAQGWGLAPASATFAADCDPGPGNPSP